MSNKESNIKEIRELLEASQKEILNELNRKQNVLQRLFSTKFDSLRAAQSGVAKAIHKLDSLSTNDSSEIAKLQSVINERNTKIQALEKETQIKQDELELVASKAKQLENQINKVETHTQAQVTQVQKQTTEPNVNNAKIETLEERINQLQADNKNWQNRFQDAKTELSEAQNISLEYYKRLKRCKSEILAV